jgi:hypothetical protein
MAKDKLWVIGGKRQRVYARATLSIRGQNLGGPRIDR